MSINSRRARELGSQLADLIAKGEHTKACRVLNPTLTQRIHFPLLEKIGMPTGEVNASKAATFFNWIASTRAEGGWVIIAAALREWLADDLQHALQMSKRYIIDANVWYATDIFGERVSGPALVLDFFDTIAFIEPWRSDPNRWIRRTVGVAIHFWAKRSRGKSELINHAKEILTFLEPMFSERDMDALKGVSRGLKTLGKYYPQLVAEWLHTQVVVKERRYRKLMLRKASLYLSSEQREYALGKKNNGIGI